MKLFAVLPLILVAAAAVSHAQTTGAPTSPTEVPTLPTAAPTPPTTKAPTPPTTKSPTLKPTVPTKQPTLRPTVNPTATIYLYSNNVWEIDGDLGSRAETTWYCENIAVTLNLFCVTHAAFMSYSPTDNMLNIPLNHLGASKTSIPVKSASGVTLASSWEALFQYPKSISFLDGGVFPPHPDLLEYSFFTGSNSDGTYTNQQDTCLDWTSPIDTDKGVVGQASEVGENSIYYGQADCNGVPISSNHDYNRVICACFYDGR